MTSEPSPPIRSYRPGPVAVTLAVLTAAFLLAPLIAVVPISLTPNRFLSMPNGHLSLRHYATLVTDPAWRDATLVSLRIALASSTLAVALATLFGLGLWLLRPRGAPVLIGFVLLPMVVPPVVSAMVLYFLLTGMSQFQTMIGFDTEAGVVLAHTVLNVPAAVVMVLVALAGIDRRIDLAARSFGASLGQRAFLVILPNIRFALGGIWVMCFVQSWDETAVTLFITSIHAVTLPRLMWMGLRDNIDPAVAAASVVLTLLTTAVLVGRILWRRRSAAD
ncbi:MAG: ABC transporter permease [Azospirillaceae bacterium]|nr:ABC transporter permease [Azospirillaceae bacterium]